MGTLSQLKPTSMPFLKVSFDRTLLEEAVPMAPQDEVPRATRWLQPWQLGEGERGGFQILEGTGVWPESLSKEDS